MNQIQEHEYETAVGIVRESGLASICFIQRRMRVGYNAAGRLIEELESRGVVSPAGNEGQRTVLEVE